MDRLEIGDLRRTRRRRTGGAHRVGAARSPGGDAADLYRATMHPLPSNHVSNASWRPPAAVRGAWNGRRV